MPAAAQRCEDHGGDLEAVPEPADLRAGGRRNTGADRSCQAPLRSQRTF